MDKKTLILILILYPIVGQLLGQEVFSKRISLGYPACVMTSIEVADSCFYTSGIVVDSISPYKKGMFISKLNWSGEIEFVKVLLDSFRSYEPWRNTLSKLPGEGFILTAYTVDDTLSIRGLLIKLNSMGDTIFVREYQSPYYLENPFFNLRDLALLPDGGFAFAAIIEKSLANNYDNDILVIRTDSLGEILWQKVYGGPTDEIVHSLIATNDGGLLIGAGKSNVGLYLIKTDGQGEEEWVYSASIPLMESGALELYQLDNNDFIVSSAKIVESPFGNLAINPFLFRLNEDLEREWEVNFFDSIPGFDNLLVKTLPLPGNQHFMAAGTGYVALPDGPHYVGKLVKASYAGDSLWTRYYAHVENQPDKHLLYDLEATPDGGFIMCGQSTGIDNPSPENPNQQGWLLKVDEHGCLVPGCHLVSSTIDLQKEPFQLKLYPNPILATGTDYLNVYFYHPKLKSKAIFQLIDASGKVLLEFESTMGDVTHMVPVSNLVSGNYWLSCRVGEDVVTKQVVVR